MKGGWKEEVGTRMVVRVEGVEGDNERTSAEKKKEKREKKKCWRRPIYADYDARLSWFETLGWLGGLGSDFFIPHAIQTIPSSFFFIIHFLPLHSTHSPTRTGSMASPP